VKALVPAGGAGTRLRPITHTTAKQLVPVANKAILDYGLESIARAGITEVGMIVGETHKQIRAHVGDGSRFGIDVTYIHQPAPLGLAHCVLIAADYLGEHDFVMYLGDNVLTGGIERFVRQFEAGRPAAQILLAKVGDPERYGVAELDAEGHVVRLVEKPKTPRSDLALVGVYLFSSRILDAVRSITPSARGELEITDAIQWLIDHGERVQSQIIDGWWKDTGKRYDLLEANRTVLDALESRISGTVDGGSEVVGRVVIEEGAALVNSVVRGPAAIGTGTRLVNTFVGPYTAIAAGCLIEDSEIEHSVVLAHTVIRGMRRIEDSLVGHKVEVGVSQRKPCAYRLMLGDHSHVELP
jgi:glucose-1-phosphate thymidylyltransferase